MPLHDVITRISSEGILGPLPRLFLGVHSCRDRIMRRGFPSRLFVAETMVVVMVRSAQRYGELVANFEAHRARLSKPQVVGIRGASHQPDRDFAIALASKPCGRRHTGYREPWIRRPPARPLKHAEHLATVDLETFANRRLKSAAPAKRKNPGTFAPGL